MAKSGYVEKYIQTKQQHTKLKFSWTVDSQSIINNTSTVSWKMELISDWAGGISSNLSKKWSVTIDNITTEGNNKIDIKNDETKTLAFDTIEIQHDVDGNKTFNFSFSQEIKVDWDVGDTYEYEYIDTVNGSGTGTLDKINRGIIYIDNGSEFESYQVFIDNGSSWDQCIPYIDNGSSWDQYG